MKFTELYNFLEKDEITQSLPNNYRDAVRNGSDPAGVARARSLAKELLLVGEEKLK